jgi:hypothetical protein
MARYINGGHRPLITGSWIPLAARVKTRPASLIWKIINMREEIGIGNTAVRRDAGVTLASGEVNNKGALRLQMHNKESK